MPWLVCGAVRSSMVYARLHNKLTIGSERYNTAQIKSIQQTSSMLIIEILCQYIATFHLTHNNRFESLFSSSHGGITLTTW